jgi:hypothetical protein
MLCIEVRCERGPAAGERCVRPQRLDVAGMRVVGLVAVQVGHEAAIGRDLQELDHRPPPVLHGPLEMRDAADHVDAKIERPFEVGQGVGRAVEAVLREGHELEIEIGRHPRLDLEQGLDPEKPIVADIDMAPDGAIPCATALSQ